MQQQVNSLLHIGLIQMVNQCYLLTKKELIKIIMKLQLFLKKIFKLRKVKIKNKLIMLELNLSGKNKLESLSV